MKSVMDIATRLVAIILLGIGISVPAHAYLDPGTGSLIIQSVIGAIAAASITAKLWWHKLKVFFSKSSAVPKNAAENDIQV
jgi:hypothetical protein